jgi:outer membrane lipoprotein SlyB
MPQRQIASKPELTIIDRARGALVIENLEEFMKKPALAIALAGSFALTACQSSSDPNVQARNAEFGCIAGTVGGAIVGGLIGSTIGGGTGRVIGTAVGLGGGGFLGNRLACR